MKGMRAHDDENAKDEEREREKEKGKIRAAYCASVGPPSASVRLFSTPFATHVEVFRCAAAAATPLDIN